MVNPQSPAVILKASFCCRSSVYYPDTSAPIPLQPELAWNYDQANVSLDLAITRSMMSRRQVRRPAALF
jgi:hypothetical protein